MKFDKYPLDNCFDEMFDARHQTRAHYQLFEQRINRLSLKKMKQYQHATDRSQLSMGMTFNVYNDNQGVERILHLDIVPRIIEGKEWEIIDRGLQQRIYALNQFIQDIYHDQKILKDKIIPKKLILSSSCFLKPCIGLDPPKGIWCHITGTDLIRDKDGQFYVLEDNLRCPSGVSYMLENREILKHTFPELFEQLGVKLVYDYPIKLLEMLQFISRKAPATVAVLTPGIYNSAYFEHSYLAQQMGVELVEGSDLVVKNDKVQMRTTKGFQPVDVIYRRIDDTFLDPQNFNPHSMLGIPGIYDLYKKGNIAMANAPGTGVADDKAVYAYVPKIIKYYLDEEVILPNVPTYLCSEKKERDYVLDNIKDLVVKETNAAGGYGMLIGPKSSKKEHEMFKRRIKKNPRNYIAQPTISLSKVPSFIDDHFEGRHVDLRPYILYGENIEVVPGGLTRVALKKGSLVVNSSQGGGSKDTWVLY
ncbi:MAG: circularly permuted type 2 ATP-grasp protein [Bacteroidetes bacterium]|nr:circularly permuted type 2 ATP-grasp protein [Bacteroidota bacterium]